VPVQPPSNETAAAEAKALNARGNEFLAQGKVAEATACYRQVAELTPGNGLAHINLGYGLMEMGDLQSAGDSFRHAIALDAGLLDAHFLLGQVQFKQHLPDEAVKSFKAALALKPDFDFAWFELGRAHESMGNPSAALEDYRSALALAPSMVEAAIGQGRMLLELARWLDGLDLAERMLSNTGHPAFMTLKARALHGLQRYDEALTAIDKVLAQNPQDSQAKHGKANILVALKRNEEALNIYLEVLAHEPEFVEALSNAATICDSLGRHDEALAFHERALAARPARRACTAQYGPDPGRPWAAPGMCGCL